MFSLLGMKTPMKPKTTLLLRDQTAKALPLSTLHMLSLRLTKVGKWCVCFNSEVEMYCVYVTLF